MPTGSTLRATSFATPSSSSARYVAYDEAYDACMAARAFSASSASTGSNVYAPGLPTCVRTSAAAGT